MADSFFSFGMETDTVQLVNSMEDEFAFVTHGGVSEEFGMTDSSQMPLTNEDYVPYEHQHHHHHHIKQQIKQENEQEDTFAFTSAMELDVVPSIGMVGSTSPTLAEMQPPIKYESIPALCTTPAPAVVAATVAAAPTMAVSVPTRGKASPRVMAKVLSSQHVKREPISPSSIASAPSPSMPALVASTPIPSPFSPSSTALTAVRSSSSSGSASGSGGSGQNSDASDSDSGSERPAKKSRKRKSARGGSSDDLPAEDGDDNCAVDMVGVPLTGDKRQQRLQRNRASAQLSRERKKQYMKLLEKQLKEMADINEGLTNQVSSLTVENAALKARLAKLAMRERVQGRFPRPPSSAASSMPGLSSSHGSPLHSHASETDSAFGSAPATPAINQVGEEDEYPQAKKLKVAAYSSPSSSGSVQLGNTNGGGARGGFQARTGMLFFTLVMSACLFYNLASNGLDGNGVSSVTNSRAHSPAVLEQIEEVVTPTTTTAAALVPLASRAGRVLASIPESTLALPVVQQGKQATVLSEDDEDQFALVPVASTNKPATSADVSLEKALNVYSSERLHSSSDRKTHQLLAAGSIDAALSASQMNMHLLRQILSAGNLTHDSASEYLFAPNAVRITPSVWKGLMNGNGSSIPSATPSDLMDLSEDHHGHEGEEKQLALFDRARLPGRGVKRGRSNGKNTPQDRLRARLPAPTDASSSSSYGASNAGGEIAPLQVGDKLLLWLPLNAVAPGVTSQQNDTTTGADATKGLVEIACHIAHVRPIVLS